MGYYILSLLLLFIGSLLSVMVKENHKFKVCSLFSGLAMIFISVPAFVSLFSGEEFSLKVNFSPLFGNVNFVIDSLSAFFVLVISCMSFIGILYANGYMQPYLNKKYNTSSHTFFLMWLIISMLLVVTVQNALFFLVVWEIMSISSFFLVIFEGDKKEVLNAGIKYMIYMHISFAFILIAFALLSNYSMSYDFNDFINVLRENSKFTNVIFLMLFIGFGTKAGFIPFHNWLPDAHPSAPTHVSGIMSGIMIKTGIYGILRLLYLIGIPSKFIAYTVLIVSVVSALWGVLYAITQHDIKRLLAYHSLENIGIIGIGIGIGLLGLVYGNIAVAILGLSGGILHILNHSIFKMLLFFASGCVYKATHTRDIELLGGLIKKMPYTSLLFIIGSVAICGLPPFNGFISEFLIYAAMIIGLPVSNAPSFIMFITALASLALIGTMAILCFTKVSGVMFLGSPRSELAQNVSCDVEKIMIIPMAILALLTLLIGIFPQYAITLVLYPVFDILHIWSVPEMIENVISITSMICLLSFIFIVLMLIVIFVRLLINRKSRIYNTWGCGYDGINSRMQYTASSYADLFVSTLKPLFKRVVHVRKPKELFPKEAYYEMKIEDIEEAYLVKPLIKMDEKFLAKFEKIQNGNMQQYILFGLIFLLLAIIGLIYIG